MKTANTRRVQVTDPHLKRVFVESIGTSIVPILSICTHPVVSPNGKIFMAYQLDRNRLTRAAAGVLAGRLARKKYGGRFKVDIDEGLRLLSNYPIPVSGCTLIAAVFDPTGPLDFHDKSVHLLSRCA